jgi:hypothetical protein
MGVRYVVPVLLFSFALFTMGCGSSNQGKIEGTKWSSMATTVKGRALPAGVLRLEFASDGKLVYQIGPQRVTGTYSVGSGDTVTLNLDQALSGTKVHQEKVVISGNKLTMTDSDGTSLTFEKVK